MKKIVLILSLFIFIYAPRVNIFAAEENKADSLTVPFINESDFPGMTITYTEKGVPIVDDPMAIYNPLLKEVQATVISPYGYFYSDSSLAESTLLFSIPRGKAVKVIDSDISDTVAKIEYAGHTGYIRKSNLKF